MIGLVMMVLSMFFWNRKYGCSAVGIDAILGNGCGIQGQKYVSLFQGSETTTGFHNRSCI